MARYRTLADHITDWSFGTYRDDNGRIQSRLMDVLKDISINAPNIHKESSINRAIIAAESYAVVYGLTDPDKDQPLALVSDSDSEGLYDLSHWDSRIDQYIRLRIGETFKMSLPEFLNSSKRMIKKLLTAAELVEKAELKEREAYENKVKQQLLQQEQNLQNGMNPYQHKVPSLPKK